MITKISVRSDGCLISASDQDLRTIHTGRYVCQLKLEIILRVIGIGAYAPRIALN